MSCTALAGKEIAVERPPPRRNPRGLDPPPNRAYVWHWVTPIIGCDFALTPWGMV
jgi:hypothetical protein